MFDYLIKTPVNLNLNWMPYFQFVVDSDGVTTIETNIDYLKTNY